MRTTLTVIALIFTNLSVFMFALELKKLRERVNHQDRILKVNQRTLDYVYNNFVVGRKQP